MDEYKVDPAYAVADEVRIMRGDGSVLPPLEGHHLEAAYSGEGQELVFTLYDALNEEQLDVCLIERDHLVDKLSFGQMFRPGALKNLTQSEARHFTFEFLDGQGWDLQVHLRPRWALPHLMGAVSRLNLFKTHFTLTRRALA